MNLSDGELRELFEATAPKASPVDVEQIVFHSYGLSRNVAMRLSAVVLAVVAAIAIVLVVFPQMPSPRGSLFAQALVEIEKIKSVSYFQASYSLDRSQIHAEHDEVDLSQPREPSEGAKQTSASILSLADELTRLKGGRLSYLAEDAGYLGRVVGELANRPDAEEVEDLRWFRIREKHLQRTDNLFPISGLHSVIDAKSHLHVSFQHPRKLRQVLGRQVVIDRETNTRTENRITYSPKLDFFRRLQSVPETAEQLSGARTIEGQEAVGFRTTEYNRGTWRRTFWISTESNLPIEIVTEYESDDDMISSSKWVQSHFVYNAEMPSELFATATPEGWASEQSEIHAIR
ncbi:MAG: hypothetical protein Aurels2KO_06830 [Aureliella sp.]